LIIGLLAILLNVLSIMAFGVLLTVAAASMFIKLKPDALSRYTPNSRRKGLWLLSLSPWLVGLLAAVFALLPYSSFFSVFDNYDLFRWHHLQEFHYNSWHGLLMIVMIGIVSLLFLQSTRSLLRNARKVSVLHALAEPDQNNFYQLDADTSMAFTLGYLRPRCYVTSALRSQLNANEYQIVQLHENAHAARLDPLKKWVFQFLTSFFPLSASSQLNQQMVVAMEQCADLAVSATIKDKTLIAMTLLKVKRLTVAPLDPALAARAVCHYGFDGVSQRIEYLLSDKKEKVFPVFSMLLVIISMTIASVLLTDFLHHAIELPLAH
jgi:Zn-dependent protease with chaperone function